MGAGCAQECHIDVKEEQLTKLMVAEGFVHGAEVIMRAETFKRCLLRVSCSSPACLIPDVLFLEPMCSFTSILQPVWLQRRSMLVTACMLTVVQGGGTCNRF